MNRSKLIFLALAFSLSFNATGQNLTDFANAKPEQWQTKSFVGETQYSLTNLDGVTRLKAEAEASASGIIFEQQIDLQETPYMSWQWRVDTPLESLDEQSKTGDDFAARVYVVIDGGLVFWNTKALTYLWSSNDNSTGQSWDNAFAGDAVRMLALQDANANKQQWYQEKRNVYEDLIAQFGDQGSERKNLQKYRYIDAVVIMTDTDNAGGNATAYYGDIVFSAQ